MRKRVNGKKIKKAKDKRKEKVAASQPGNLVTSYKGKGNLNEQGRPGCVTKKMEKPAYRKRKGQPKVRQREGKGK